MLEFLGFIWFMVLALLGSVLVVVAFVALVIILFFIGYFIRLALTKTK